MSDSDAAPLDLICLAPLRVEALAVTSGMRSRPEGRTARVVRSGAGGRSTGAWSRSTGGRTGSERPSPAGSPATVVTGVAGGLSAGIAAGHLVVADVLIGVDGAALDVDLSGAPGLAAA
ncbi:MAG: hypothetical protein M3Y91_10760, partial [Actinomycetota bacterium]|nr:hypothetical protein [Actinomycetota bacterium]